MAAIRASLKPAAAPLSRGSGSTVPYPTISEGDVPEKVEFVIPVDFEQRQQLSDTLRDPLWKEVLQFPANDLVVEIQKRDSRIQIQQTKKEELALLPVHIRDSIEVFTRDWITTRKVSEQYSRSVANALDGKTEPPYEKQYYEIDFVTRGEFLPDADRAAMDKDLLKVPGRDTKQQDFLLRQKDRHRLFGYFPKFDLSASDNRPRGSAPFENLGTQIYVSAKEVKFQLEIEPFWCTLFLYDTTKGRKLSEDFHFDLNPPNLMAMLKGRPGPPDAPTQASDAIFSVTHIHPEVFLVLCIDKVLTGEGDHAVEPYLKATTLKPKEIQKLTAEIQGACERLGNYTQPFAIAAIPLFSPTGTLAHPVSVVQFPHIARFSDDVGPEHLPTYINRLINEKERKKLKLIPGRASVEIKVLTSSAAEDLNARRLSPSLFPVLPYPEKAAKIVREVAEFHDDTTNLAPQLSYVHHLYVYPESLNFSNYSGSAKHRNMSVNVRFKDSDTQPTDPGMRKIYGKSTSPNFVLEANTGVTYHASKSQYHDEIKIELPNVLTPRHHLLFTMNHIVCQEPGKKEKKDFHAEIMAAAIPLGVYSKQNSIFVEDKQHILNPFLQLPPNYLAHAHADANHEEHELKLVEKKPGFVVRTRLVSSIYTQDPALNTFFNRYDSGRDDGSLIEAIRGLKNIGKPTALRFLPVILNELFRIMVVGSENSSKEAFKALFYVLVAATVNPLTESMATENMRSNWLLSYVQFMFDNVPDARKFLFEEAVRDFIVLLKEHPEDVYDDACRYAWFVFDILVKSMAIKLWQTKELLDEAGRPKRFGEIAYELLEALLLLLVKEVQTRVTTGLALARELNRNVAFFLKDLLSVMDRGQVFRLIHAYISNLQPSNADITLVGFKFQALKILVDYEHYVPLNWPILPKIPPVSVLPQVFWKNHFMAGLFLRELEPMQLHPDKATRVQAITTFRGLLVKHDVDPRLQKPEVKQRVLAIYLPYILMLIEQSSSIVQRAREKDKDELQHWLVCFLYILTGIDRRLVREWWRKETQKRLLYFFVVLARSLDVFEYDPETGAGVPTASAASLVAAPAPPSTDDTRAYDDPMGLKRQQTSNTLRGRKSQAPAASQKSKALPALTTPMIVTTPVTLTPAQPAGPSAADLSLPREVALIVLDLLSDFMEDYETDLEKEQSVFMRNFFEVFLLLLKKNQAQSVLSCLWRFARTLVNSFTKQLFRYNNSYCSDLTYEVLRHAAFRDPVTRSEATAILYLLMKRNYDEMKQFARMKLQATIGISRLVGEGVVANEPTFHRALDLVKQQAYADDKGEFSQQAEELCQRLASVLHNSTKLDEFKYDPEMTAELYYQISKGYTDSPDLRVTWLENLATYHRQKSNFLEAAQCRIHISAIVSEYLTMLKPTEAIHVDKAAFLRLSPNIMEDLVIPQGISKNESICQTSAFTRKGLFDQLYEAVEHMKKSDLFESAIEVERFVAAIYKKNRNYAKLAECYTELHQFCEKIVKVNQDNSRLFSNYYRVAYFGDLLPELDGKEYIYKEHPMVRLADITERLKAQYFAKFSQDKVKVLPNKPVDRASLAPGNLYLQIVAVEEYLEPHELKDRVTPFERKFNLSRFIFETPFTQAGKAQGDFKEQYKRKTILTTELPFPYVKKRIMVVNKAEIILTPIETSTEIIEGRVTALRNEVERFNPSTRTLQIVLQGCILLQVNAGPLEICRIFLGNPAEYPPEHVERLRGKMREFVLGCHAGVLLNKKLIAAEQLELQEKLEEGYGDLVKKMVAYKLGDFPSIAIKGASMLDMSVRESTAGPGP